MNINSGTLSRRALLGGASSAFCCLGAVNKNVVFVLGDHEYSGEVTMPLLAAELDKRFGVRSTILKSQPDQNAKTNLPGMEALEKADLAVFFLRWRRLPQEQLAHIERYVRSRKPMIGIRTTSHAFNYPKDHVLAGWHAWAADVFSVPPGWGADGHNHYGHESSTDVKINRDQADHPILTGITGPFHVRSWLYHVVPKWPPDDAKTLLMGTAIKQTVRRRKTPLPGHGQTNTEDASSSRR